MNFLDLLVMGVLVYFIVSRFTSGGLPKSKAKNSGIKINVIKKDGQSKEQIEQIFKKAREMSEELREKEELKKSLTGLDKVKAFDSDFTEKKFLAGAKKAYMWFYDCLNKDNEADLESLLSPRVYSQVVDHLDSLDDSGEKEVIDVKKLEEPVLLDCKTVAKSAFIDVKYKAELIIKTINEKTKEETEKTEIREVVWTWARNVTSTDPNWQLDEVKNVS